MIFRIVCIVLLLLSNQAFAGDQGQMLTKDHSETKIPAKRIIALAPHIVEMLYAIGAGDRIIGTTSYSDYPDEAKKIPQIGGYHGVQIEKIIEMAPDLIIVWKGGNKADDIAKLRQLNMPMAYSRPKTLEDIAHEVTVLGKLTGLEKNAKKVADDFLVKAEEIKKKYQGKPVVRAFYQLWFEPLRTVGPNSWLQYLLSYCGAENVFADAVSDYPLVSQESVIVKMPSVMIIPENHGTYKTQEVLSIWGQWKQVPAIKNQHIYTVDSDLMHRTTPRMLNGLADMCEKIDRARQ